MVDSLKDPYTVYYTKEEMLSFTEKTEGNYAGIGITVKPENGLLKVMETFSGSPAEVVGIKAGDAIVKVDQTDVTGIKDSDLIVNMIKGPEDTKVVVSVFREGEPEFLDFTLTRRRIKLEHIQSEILEGNIGYIRILFFDGDIATIFNGHLDRLLFAQIQSLIVDVRDNPGGSYTEVVHIADRILPNSLIVYTEDREGKRQERRSGIDSLDLPIVVLINENSASASEILAGSLRDNKKAVLVGKKTFGKGLVQEIEALPDGSGLKVTIAKYYTPSGVNIDKEGIRPDYEVDLKDELKNLPVSQLTKDEDAQLLRAIEILKEK
jgi:carboxyl-terminal processing protease